MKIYRCTHCHFITKQKYQKCPLCQQTMEKNKGEIDYHLPNRLDNEKRDVKLYYTCIKCRREGTNKICIHCNKIGLLSISYNGKSEIVKRLNSLFDLFTPAEVNTILSQITKEEKYFLYTQFASTQKMRVKKDPVKASVCFFVALLIYYTAISISFNYEEQIISIVSNAFGNATFTIFMVLGFYYLVNAPKVENENVAGNIGTISGVIQFLYFLFCLFTEIAYEKAFLLGLISIVLTVIIYFILTVIKRNNYA